MASFLAAIMLGCGGADGDLPVLSADMPLHLEDHLDAARVTGSVGPTGSEAVEWRFDGAETLWRVAPSWSPLVGPATVELTGEALRVTLTEDTRYSDGERVGVSSSTFPRGAAPSGAT
jgi:hypothetical protein